MDVIIGGFFGNLFRDWIVVKLAMFLFGKLQLNNKSKIIVTFIFVFIFNCMLLFMIHSSLIALDYIFSDIFSLLYLLMISILRLKRGNMFIRIIDNLVFRIVTGLFMFLLVLVTVPSIINSLGGSDPYYLWGLLISAPYTTFYIMNRTKNKYEEVIKTDEMII